MSETHYLKTWPVYFRAVESGSKSFEVRRNDRGFQTGDTVILQYHDPDFDMTNASRSITRKIGWILQGGQFGVEPGYCVFGLEQEPHND
jgi:hypothetical protein